MIKWVMYLKTYLKHNVGNILIPGLVILAYELIYFLSNNSLQNRWYSFEIALFIIIVSNIYQGRKYYNKIKRIEKLAKQYGVDELFNTIENDTFTNYYEAIIVGIEQQAEKNTLDKDRTFYEILDYYNLWIHEIKTPIFALKLLVEKKVEDMDVQMQLREQIFFIEQYTEMSLNYLRIENLENDLEFGCYNLSDIIKDIVKKYSIIFINKEIDLEIEIPSNKVVTDRKWLGFIIEQILSNALKYTNEGKIMISYNGEKQLNIKDTGIGIAEEDIERIFEKAFTGNNGRINKESTGMGLYLCKKVARVLGIEIKINSEIRKGTEVVLSFNENKLIES